MNHRNRPFMILILSAMLLMTTPSQLFAQSEADNEPPPQLGCQYSLRVVPEQFPEKTVYIFDQPSDTCNLSLLEATLLVNNEEVDKLDDAYEETGRQTAIVIDPVNLAQANGTAKSTIIDSLYIMAQDFHRRDEVDYVALYTLDDQGTFQAFRGEGQDRDWDSDATRVFNSLNEDVPTSDEGFSLSTLLFSALERIADDEIQSQIHPGAARSLIFFSVREDALNDADIQALGEFAEREQIHIYPIVLNIAEETEEGASGDANLVMLNRLASRTGGQVWTPKSAQDLDGLWGRLERMRMPRVLRYRTETRAPESVTVNVQIPTTGDPVTVSANADVPTIELPPLELSVLIPSGNEADEVTVENDGLHIEIEQPVWPDGTDRPIRNYRYILHGSTTSKELRYASTDNTFVIPVAELNVEAYTLQVEAEDGYNIQGNAQPVEFSITSLPGFWSGLRNFSMPSMPSLNRWWISLGSAGWLLASMLGVLVVGFVFRTSRHQLRRRLKTQESIAYSGESFTESENEAENNDANTSDELEKVETQPQEPAYTNSTLNGQAATSDSDTEPGELPDNFVPAWLIHVDGGLNPPPRIRLMPFIKQTIGRSRERSRIVIAENVISKLHCSIISDDNKIFYLVDEGAKGGTFLNRRLVGPEEKLQLEHGDEINLNVITYRFELGNTGNEVIEAPKSGVTKTPKKAAKRKKRSSKAKNTNEVEAKAMAMAAVPEGA